MICRKLLIFIFSILLFSCDEMSEDGQSTNEFVLFEDEAQPDTQTIPNEKKSELIQMRKVGGVYFIPAKVNGIPLDFVFDTGASLVSISLTEAIFMAKQGSLNLSESEQKLFEDANGNINEGSIVILKSLQIGGRVLYNVRANVVQNLNAPLLLGQSALERFGKVSVDYSTGIMELEY